MLVLGTLAGLSSLSLDPFVPSLPALVREFGAPVTTVQMTVTVFFIGLACGQLVYGPVSDHYGRRPPLIFGLALFLIATLYCANAVSILERSSADARCHLDRLRPGTGAGAARGLGLAGGMGLAGDLLVHARDCRAGICRDRLRIAGNRSASESDGSGTIDA